MSLTSRSLVDRPASPPTLYIWKLGRLFSRWFIPGRIRSSSDLVFVRWFAITQIWHAPLSLDGDDTFDFSAIDVPYDLTSSFWGSKDITPPSPDADADDSLPDSRIGGDDDMPDLELSPSADRPLGKARTYLAHVHQTLYKQLVRLQSDHCDLAEVLRVTCVHHHHHHHMESCESPSGRGSLSCSSLASTNPLATVATIAAEFVDILSALMPPALDDPSPLSSLDLLILSYHWTAAHTGTNNHSVGRLNLPASGPCGLLGSACGKPPRPAMYLDI